MLKVSSKLSRTIEVAKRVLAWDGSVWRKAFYISIMVAGIYSYASLAIMGHELFTWNTDLENMLDDLLKD